MKTIELEKVIHILEWIKRHTPGRNGILPHKFATKENIDCIIQRLREKAVEVEEK